MCCAIKRAVCPKSKFLGSFSSKRKCAKERASRHQFHLAAYVSDGGRNFVWRVNDVACCAERRLLEEPPPMPCQVVVLRAAVTTTRVAIKPSQPCGKCRTALTVKSVTWSTEGGFASCDPSAIPHNDFCAKNRGTSR